MHRTFKIGYNKAVRLVLIFAAFGLLSIILNVSFSELSVPQYVLLPLLYVMPFALFFLFFHYKIQKEKVVFELLFTHSPKKIYPLIFFLIFCGMITTDYTSSIIPQDGPVWGKMYQSMEQVFEEQTRHPISMIISIVFLAPICEEIFFRGILLNGLLHKKIHPIKAILFSSFLFGIIHMNPWQFVGGMLCGSLLGLVYFCTRSISNCILLHAFNNGLAILTFLYKEKYGGDPITTFLNANPGLFFAALCLTMISAYMLISQTEKTWKNWSLSLETQIN